MISLRCPLYAFITTDLTPTAPRYITDNYQQCIFDESSRDLRNKSATLHLNRIISLHANTLLECTLSSSEYESADKPGMRPLGWWTLRPQLSGTDGGHSLCRQNPLLHAIPHSSYHARVFYPWPTIRVVNAVEGVCSQSCPR